MNKHYPLIIIGAGPAGLAAACTAAQHGIECVLIDEQQQPGGQIYRGVETAPTKRQQILGRDYIFGKKLAEEFRNSNAHYLPNTKVWSVSNNREVGILVGDNTSIITADQVIIATGAMERPVPFKGWTLPGVMPAGAGQILLKNAGLVPGSGVVLAGSGPLLLLLAWQYIRAGVKVKALLDVTPLKNHLFALRKLPKALLAMHYITKGIGLQIAIKAAGVPMYFAATNIQAEGDDCLSRVSFTHKGKQRSIQSDLLLSHFGVIPQASLTQAAGCTHQWDEGQQCWRPCHDQWGATSVEGLLVAGDGAGIHGARSAEFAGKISALQAVHALGGITEQKRDALSKPARKWMRKENHIRPFLEAYYQIPESLLATVDDQTIVCRCEEVTAGQVRQAIANGHTDSNQVKFLTRCGMGPCQGRQCSNAVAHIVAQSTGKPMDTVGHFRGRPPTAPITLGQIATLTGSEP